MHHCFTLFSLVVVQYNNLLPYIIVIDVFFRSGFYRGIVGPLPDPWPDKPLVESAFGLVQEGSVLSCQQPVLTTRYITLHRDAPPTPHLPLEGYDIKETLLAQTACDIFSNRCAEQVSKEHAVWHNKYPLTC